MFHIRDAVPSDLPRLLEIYDYYTQCTAISFEWETPSPEEFFARMERITARYPYLVAEQNGRVMGYAYAAPFIGRAAYDWCCELTIYLAPEVRKQGMGRALYEALEDALRRMGVLDLYACVGVPEAEDEYLNFNSADFHAHLGFETVGTFRECGHKFDRWYHMIWMKKTIGAHQTSQPAVIAYPELEQCEEFFSLIC